MALLVVRGIDLSAVGAAVAATAMAGAYRSVVEGQGNDPATWVLVILLAGALLALAGAPIELRHRVPVLLAATGLLGVVGLLGILTIGLPVLAAAGLALVAALRKPAAPRTASAP